MNRPLHSLNLATSDRDTLPPTCNPPYICEGLESLILDVGIMRQQLDRVEANQELILDAVRKLNLAIGIIRG